MTTFSIATSAFVGFALLGVMVMTYCTTLLALMTVDQARKTWATGERTRTRAGHLRKLARKAAKR